MLTLPILTLALLAASSAAAPPPGVPHAAHVTIVMMENRNYASIVGNPSAPYFNHTLVAEGMLLRNYHAIAHPSEPNYLALFSGSTQGVTGDDCPVEFGARNLATELAAAGLTFAGYAESMPRDGYRGCVGSGGLYGRKHVPWADFADVSPEQNRVYRGFPADPPAVLWITPNMCDDMHDCSTRTGDRWLAAHLPQIVAWDAKHDGWLVVTWDEADPDPDASNRVPAVIVGPMVAQGASDRRADHYALLRTIEENFRLPCIARECSAAPIAGIWR